MAGSNDDAYAHNKARAAALEERQRRLRALNDAFRLGRGSGMLVVTPGIRELNPDALATVLTEVRAFRSFGPDNDPCGEHDFGSIDVEGRRIFWKIDCYDKQLEYGSPDAANPDVTTRVLTIMLAEEY